MSVNWHRTKFQLPVKQKLPWSGTDQVVTTDDLADALSCIIHHTRQLIAGIASFGRDQKIAHHMLHIVRLGPRKMVLKFDKFIWYAPVENSPA